MQQLSARVHELRRVAGLSQEDLSTISGIPRVYVSLIETGKVEPTEEIFYKLQSVIFTFMREKIQVFSQVLTEDERERVSA